MGFYFRKSINFCGIRFNLSKSGIGGSTGFKGFRIGSNPRGNYIHVGRNGLYYRAFFGKKGKGSNVSNETHQGPITPNDTRIQNNNEFFIEIDSADTTKIVDSSSEELINEINSNRKKVTLKWFALLGILLYPSLALVMLGILAYIDYYRKTTVILYDIDEDKGKELQRFYDAFDELKNCKKQWHITSYNHTSNYKYNSGAATLLNRVPIVIRNQTPKNMKTNISIPCIPVGKQKLYFFPDRILIDNGKNVGGISYENLEIKAYNTRFIETQMKPSDGVMIDQTWRYVNKNGGPDRRFTNNYMIPIMQYTEMNFTSDNGLNEEIQLSRPNVGQLLINELKNISKNSFSELRKPVVSQYKNVTSNSSEITKESEEKIESEQEKIQKINDIIRKTLENDETSYEIYTKNEYHIPSSELLLDHFDRKESKNELIEQKKERLKEVLYSFGIDVSIEDAIVSNRITTFEIKLLSPVKISKITSLKDDLAIALNSEIVNIVPIVESGTIGIEIQNDYFTNVFLKDVIESDAYKSDQSKDIIILGNSTKNEIMITSFSKTGSMLISGTTGSGKSAFINVLIMGLVFKAEPEEIKMILIDLKKVELTRYSNLPHLLIPVLTDKKKVIGALEWINMEIDNRFSLFQKRGVKNYDSYILIQLGLPRLIVIIDEFADLVGENFAEIQTLLENIVRNGNKVGVYMVLASERPSGNIVSGALKSNIFTRIAFKAASKVDSRIILESEGAEKLFGKGDMLYITRGVDTPIRMQGAYVNDKEIDLVMNYCTQFTDKINNNVHDEIIQKSNIDKAKVENAETDEFLEDVNNGLNNETNNYDRKSNIFYKK